MSYFEKRTKGDMDLMNFHISNVGLNILSGLSLIYMAPYTPFLCWFRLLNDVTTEKCSPHIAVKLLPYYHMVMVQVLEIVSYKNIEKD
jgi:hypothetical protein